MNSVATMFTKHGTNQAFMGHGGGPASISIRELWTTIEMALLNISPEVFQPLVGMDATLSCCLRREVLHNIKQLSNDLFAHQCIS